MANYRDNNTFSGTNTFTGPVDLSGATVTQPTGQSTIRKWTSGIVPKASLSAGTSNSIDLPADENGDGAFPTGVQVMGAYIEVTTAITITGGDTTSCVLGLGVSGNPTSYLATGANLAGAGTGKKENATGTLVGSYRAADTPQLYVSGGGGDPDMADINTFGARAVIFYLASP